MWLAATNAFIADISEPDQKAFRMGMMHLSGSLAGPISAPMGAFLYAKGNVLV